MAEPVRHGQTKEAATDMFYLKLPRHISTLPIASILARLGRAKLVAKGLSLEDVRSQVANATVDSPKGNVDGDKRAYTIYANDQLLEAKDWNDVIIAYRGAVVIAQQDGARLLMEDLLATRP